MATKSRFKKVLGCLAKAEHIQPEEVDDISNQFEEMVSNVQRDFQEFEKDKSMLDALYCTAFPKEKFAELWIVIRKLLLLSHGQAAVECGFSLGNALSKEPQQPETVRSLKLVTDHILSIGGLFLSQKK